MQGRRPNSHHKNRTETMIKEGDKIYACDCRWSITFPIEGTVLKVTPNAKYSGMFDVQMLLFLPEDDYLIDVNITGTYTPGATLTSGGCEYVEIDHSDNRFNGYLFTDRIYNLQLCLQQSVLHVNNAKFYCGEILQELRSLGQEPPEDVTTMMNGFGLK